MTALTPSCFLPTSQNARLAVALAAFLLFAPPALSEDAGSKPADAPHPLIDWITGGKPILHMVARWEYAKIDKLQHSHGATVRTRLGYQTKPVYGFTGLAEMVNTSSPTPSAYFDGIEANDGPQTIVADPERTDVNRVWLGFKKKEWAGLDFKAGRQRIKLDDDRWIGNVGWRQNEQTYDAARLQTNLGMEKLNLQYVYVWQVNRIFADKGGAGTKDFGPRAHFVNLSYKANKKINATAFAYLIDPNQANFRAFGSATYGVRFTGALPISEKLSFPYQASYAYQEDYGSNQTSYGAHYYMLQGGVKVDKLATISAGYEVLGTDNDARVVTPFSTAHKFNGFADAFLNNGGTRGLRDLYASIAPAIPVKGLKFKFAFHQFWDDQGGDNLGQEYDFVTSYAINKYVSFLYKFAYYDGGNKPAFSKRTRSTLDMTVKF